MPKRSENRDLARDLYLQSKGKLTPKEIAEKLGIKPELVRKWKSMDQWDDFWKGRRGGQRGNKNSKGHGAPKGNKNGEKHGAYSRTRLDLLPEEQRKEILAAGLDFSDQAKSHLQGMLAKKADLEIRIARLESEMDQGDKLYIDSQSVMDTGRNKIITTNSSSAYTRWYALNEELGRTEGRITRLLDSIRNERAEGLRIQLERDRLNLARQKAMGIFSTDEEGNLAPLDEEDRLVEA